MCMFDLHLLQYPLHAPCLTQCFQEKNNFAYEEMLMVVILCVVIILCLLVKIKSKEEGPAQLLLLKQSICI